MEQTKAYHRGLYRLPVTYPAMYCGMSTVGEGTITNLSAVGCTIETDQPLRADQDVALCLLLPDQHESLPIELAHVRWVHGHRAGIEFVQVEPTANLRLYGFVLDQMVQRSIRFNRNAQRLRPRCSIPFFPIIARHRNQLPIQARSRNHRSNGRKKKGVRNYS